MPGGPAQLGPHAHSSLHHDYVSCRRLGAAAAALAAGYVAAQGRRLSLAARRSCDAPNWLAHREPRAPRPVCALLLELLAAAEAEVVQLVDDGGARPAGTSYVSRCQALHRNPT